MGSGPWRLRLAAGLAVGAGLLVPQSVSAAGAGSFGPTGSMGTPRYAAAAAPLADGRVLVAGGFYDDAGGDHYLASAEIFNPLNGAFSSAGGGPVGPPPPGAGGGRGARRRGAGRRGPPPRRNPKKPPPPRGLPPRDR